MAKLGNHDHEAGSSSGIRAAGDSGLSIALRAAATRICPYVKVKVCQHYWDTSTPPQWPDGHLPIGWHMIPDWVPVPAIPGERPRVASLDQPPPGLVVAGPRR